MAARYVSGYVHQPGEIATHAWVQVWAGAEAGWVNIDPTHACWVGSDHVVIAVGRDFSDVPPNRGVWKGDAEETITVAVSVRPVDRMTADLTEPVAAGWSAASGSVATGKPDRQPRPREFRQQQSQQQQV
jgi:transglutaminase-like putative cysteine protease